MILPAVLLVLLWGTVAARLPTLWRDRRQRALWASVASLALCKTASFPPVAEMLHAPIAPHLLGVLAASFLLRFITLVTGAAGGRRQLALVAGVLALLGVLAAVSGGIGTSAELLTGDLPGTVVAYWVVLEAYLGTVLVTATALFWTLGRAAPTGLPRLGLRALAIGSCLIALYAAFKTVLIVAHGFGAAVDFPAIEPVAHRVQTVGVLLAVGGAVAPAGHRARAAARAYRDLLALRPLWTAMRDAFPEVILFTPRRAVIELAGVDDVHLRLYRRVIEIRDGLLALRDYLPAEVPAAADPAVTEARAVALALRRRAAGEPAGEPGSWAPVGPDMADEVAWLSRVSAACRGADLRVGVRTPRPSGSAR
ncbi:MAB_1171c family putative transporter [Micromonosporaceae bacterium Da 78-11]